MHLFVFFYGFKLIGILSNKPELDELYKYETFPWYFYNKKKIESKPI